MVTNLSSPLARHVGADDLPFVDIGDGNKLKLVLVRPSEGLWIIETIFQSGKLLETHRHTGPVFGFTVAGAWKYVEYEYVNRAGSFLYEPAGSIHTLQCLEDDTRMWFQLYGANLNFAENGTIERVSDGPTTLGQYVDLCLAQGLGHPPVIVD